MQKLEMIEKIKEIYIFIWSIYDLKKKRKLTKIQIFVELHGRSISPKFLNLLKKIINPKEKLFYKILNHMWL